MFLNKYNNKILSPIVSILALVFLHYCADPEENSDDVQEKSFSNTLGSQIIGDGSSGPVEQYFYNFDDAIDATYFMYGKTRFDYSYDKYISIFSSSPPEMTMKNFPEYLLSVSPDSTQFVTRHPVDTLFINQDTIISNDGAIVQDSIQLSSTQFKNLESIEWDLDAEPSLQRYRLRNSSWVQKDTIIHYADTFDVKIYKAVLDTPLINDGIMFVDTSEWKDTSYAFIKDQLMIFTNNFEFERTQLSADSLIFRINTDCNDNNRWDDAELGQFDYNNDGDMKDVLFEIVDNIDYDGDGSLEDVVYEFNDRGNDLIDPAEVFYDINNNGSFDLNEPYEDRNCNGQWDNAEDVDFGNGKYDEAEDYTLKDLDNDGESEKQLFIVGEVPNNLLVDWSDSLNPRVLIDISIGDDLTDRWGNVFNDIIETVNYVDAKREEIGDIDSLVTLYTNDVVGHITNGDKDPGDYYITKTDWEESNLGESIRQYNYQIFSQNDHVDQLVYKNYFLPLGFYWSENQVKNGFWHKDYLENETFLYTYNGLLRDGEEVDTAYYDTTDIAIYFIEKNFDVELSQVTVPAARKNYTYSDGVYTCLRDNSLVDDAGQCPKADTTFSDCFKVTQITIMTMMGSGVEYGQKVYTWLAKDHGVVKSDMYIRWSDNPYFESSIVGEIDEFGRIWTGYSKIELSKLDIEKSGNVFREMFQSADIVKLKDLEYISDFNYDPFKISNQTGFHTIEEDF